MSTGKRILFVTKDAGGFNVAKPVRDALAAAGHKVVIFAEGVAAERWADAGDTMAYRGAKNFKETPFSFDALASVRALNPDVVVVTMGAPINMENSCALAAKELGIPLVVVEDIWASFTRTQAKPDLVFTLDAFGLKLLNEDERTKNARKIVSGNPAVQHLVIPEELRERMEEHRFRYGRLVLFCGEGEGTADLLRVALGSLQASEKDFALIPRFHPKYVDNPMFRSTWNGMLELFSSRGKGQRTVLRLDDVKNTDALAALCDINVSGVSTTLIHAAKNGRLPVAITTPYCQALYQPHVAGKYQRFPGIDLGYALELTEPVDDLLEVCFQRGPACRAAAKKTFAANVSPQQMAVAIMETAK